MILDIVAALVILVSAWAGWQSGSALQVIRLLVLVICVVLGVVVGHELAKFYVGTSPSSNPGKVTVVWFLVAFGVLFGVVSVAVRRFTVDMRDHSMSERSRGDQAGGALVGAARGLVLTYVALVSLATLTFATGSPQLPYEDSIASRFALSKSFLASSQERLTAHIEENFEVVGEPEPDVKEIGGSESVNPLE